MDPIFNLDIDGNGSVTFYAHSTSYTVPVSNWVVATVAAVASFDVQGYVQEQVNRYRASLDASRCGYST